MSIQLVHKTFFCYSHIFQYKSFLEKNNSNGEENCNE